MTARRLRKELSGREGIWRANIPATIVTSGLPYEQASSVGTARKEAQELVIQPQAEQHLSHVAGTGHQAKVSTADVGAWIIEICMVQKIVQLPTELQLGAFFNSEVL